MSTTLPGPVSTVLGLVPGGCVADSRPEERHEAVHGRQGGQSSVIRVLAAMLITPVTMVVPLGWSTLVWRAAGLAATVTGPVLVAGATGVRALAEQLLRRGGPAAGALAAGAGAWVVSSLTGGALPPVSRPRPRHL
ncbi:hypothetical protein [Streptomyces sp. NPDC058861]|uniref:hypothetical protein n=1 Tax=Streptomyces sp. NPDC058861 TaxID=3346653 RepID=UPI0036B59F9A